MSHTPGPWHIGMRPGPIIYGSDSSQVADCRGDLLSKAETLANVRLIAAAPDLLAALKIAANFIESGESAGYSFFQVREAWRNALGKARGDS